MSIEKIGRYKIIGELGKGAMGVVYKAEDPNIGRVVALKTMRVDAAGTEAQELLARFRNEARAAGGLNHPNIVTIYDAGEHEGLFYMAMEILEGETLQHKMKHGSCTPEDVVSIGCQVGDGLDYAHSRGVIHRDIKPANIMILPDDTVKIMDFGIAKAGASLTTTGQVVGTPNYMSPEQVRGKHLDGRTDLFSLGVVLYEMLTGERPFTGDNVTTIVYKIVNEQPPEPRALDPSVHPGLNAVVLKSVAKAPNQRYQTGAELARDLMNFRLLGTEATATSLVTEAAATGPAPAVLGAGKRLPPSGKIPAAHSSPPMAAAAAVAPAAPARVPTPDSTVEAPRPAPAADAKKRGSLPIVLVALAVLIGGALYLRTRGPQPGKTPASPAATQESSPSASPGSNTKPEEPGRTAPSTSAATVAETGALRITSSPESATVLIDGRSEPKWLTPFTASQLQPGTHTVAFSKQGYEPVTLTVEVPAGKRVSVSAELKPTQAVLAVSSEPPGATIFLDGKPTGQVTPAQLSVGPGQHHVGLLLEGYKPERVTAEAGAGQTLNISPILKPQEGGRPFSRLKRFFGGGPEEKGFIEIRTRPRGAEIWIGEMKAPVKTPTRIPINAGTYRITLRLPGFRPVMRSVNVEKGKVYGIEEILEPQ